MKRLDAERVVYLVVHTAAFTGSADVDEVRRWHLERGWEDIGYHFYIRRSGELQIGRSLEYQGAHCLGINHESIGVCCEGDGDSQPFRPEQEDTLLQLAVRLHVEYGIHPQQMIGHREINRLVSEGKVPAKYLTAKSCPGRMVHMPKLRRMFTEALWPPPDGFPPEIVIPRAA